MLVKAVAKGVRMSPRKVGVVASLVNGRTVEDALVILNNTPRKAAIPVRKTIESAKANADHNHNVKPDSLKIVEISVTVANHRLKRARPAARGRALAYQLKSSHIRVILEGDVREVKKPAKAAESTKKETK
jgi:large subunit ribosomal protein L22